MTPSAGRRYVTRSSKTARRPAQTGSGSATAAEADKERVNIEVRGCR